MTIPPDLEAQIQRYYHVEKWRVGTIARQLLRDDLDENGGGDLDFEAAAGSGVMIVADLQLCKFFRRRC